MPHPLQTWMTEVDRWLRYMETNRGRSPATCDLYRARLKKFAGWILDPPADAQLRASTQDLAAVTADDLELYTGLVLHRARLAPRSRRIAVSALRGFYRWRAARSGAGQDPARDLPYPSAGRRIPRTASLRNAERLLMQPDIGTLAGLRDALIIALLAGVGMRVSGLVALNESDVYWDPEDSSGMFLRLEEKGHHQRYAPVPNEAAMLMRAYLGHQDLVGIDRDLKDGDKVLLVSLRNRMVPEDEYRGEARRMTENGIRERMLVHAAAAGIPRDQANPHAFRHLVGTELAESKADLIDRQVILGHASPSSTSIYTHLARRHLRKLIDDAGPLGKMRGSLLDDLRAIAATEHHARGRSGLATGGKS